jgi:hypothetical protein
MNNQETHMNRWNHLPNAAHIDLVRSNLTAYPSTHHESSNTRWSAERQEATDAARVSARRAILDTKRHLIWDATLYTSSCTANSTWRDALLALIVYDHCAPCLSMTADQLRVWGALSNDPAAILLLPYVTFLEHSTNKEPV